MLKLLRASIVMLVLMTVLTGLLYPAVITGIAQVIFPYQANGSLIVQNGQVVGSTLIGQPFDDPKYFWGRLSATSPYPYNGAASAASNLGPLNDVLTQTVQSRAQALRAADPGNNNPIPVDLVTASASGLDPDISLASAEYQVARVARARGMDVARVRQLVAQNTTGRFLGLLGEPVVNVLQLNLALDQAK
jgi:potassium-transporting ATPase KdpC subunit